MSGIISNVKIEGELIDSLVEHLDGTLEGVPDGAKVVALISYALSLQKPDLTPEQAIEGVKQVSQYIALWLSETDSDALTDEEKRKKVN